MKKTKFIIILLIFLPVLIQSAVMPNAYGFCESEENNNIKDGDKQ